MGEDDNGLYQPRHAAPHQHFSGWTLKEVIMAGRKPDFRVCVAEGEGDSRFFTDVGAGWRFDGGKASGISVKLRANIAISGELVLFEARE